MDIQYNDDDAEDGFGGPPSLEFVEAGGGAVLANGGRVGDGEDIANQRQCPGGVLKVESKRFF